MVVSLKDILRAKAMSPPNGKSVRNPALRAKVRGLSEVVTSPACCPDEHIGDLQTALSQLMRSREIRSPSLAKALKHVARAMAVELGVDRAGILVLDATGNHASFSKVFDVASGTFQRHSAVRGRNAALLFNRTSGPEVVAIDDVRKPNSLSEFTPGIFERLGIKSAIHAPVVSSGEVIGFVTANTVTRFIRWRTEQLLFISAIANLVALTIERNEKLIAERNAHSLARLLRRRQGAMDKLMHSVVRHSGSPSLLYDDVSEALFDNLGIDRVIIRLSMDMDSVAAYRRDLGRPAESQLHDSVKLGEVGWSPAFFSALRQGPLCVDDGRTHPLTRKLYEQHWQQQNVRSAMAAPILVNDALQGAVFCVSRGKSRIWSPADRLFISGISSMLSLAYEQERRENSEQQLRHALHAKGRFLANMSHEIRTPMNGVLGVTALLEKSQLSHRQSELVGIIRQSSESLLSIINDILDVSRIENGALKIDNCDFDMASSVEQVVSLFADQARQKGLQFDLFIDNNTPTRINSDPVRFRQILVNIVGNAIKFTEQGSVTVRMSRQFDRINPTGVVIAVKDTGIGIPAEVQGTLFKPFAQGDSSISRRFGGTGLGLAIARDLAKLMGGELTIGSTRGAGTTLSFVLPIDNEQSIPSLDRTAVRSREGIDVLIAGDRRLPSVEALEHYVLGLGASCRLVDDFDLAESALSSSGLAMSAPRIGIFHWQMIGADPARLRRLAALKSKVPCVKLVLLGGTWNSDEPQADECGTFSGFLEVPLFRSAAIGILTSMLSPKPLSKYLGSTPADVMAHNLKCKILFAEDHRINRLVAKEFLSRHGCQVTFANDGREAVDAFATDTFDIVMMDCQMPNLDGMSATREIRQMERNSLRPPTPIIAVTANAYEQDRIECVRSGMDDYISKPYTEQQLIDAINRWKPQETS